MLTLKTIELKKKFKNRPTKILLFYNIIFNAILPFQIANVQLMAPLLLVATAQTVESASENIENNLPNRTTDSGDTGLLKQSKVKV